MAKLLAVLKILALPKGLNYSFNTYLNSNELDCKCKRKACHYTLVNETLIMHFYDMRYDLNRPLKINSAYRCQAHNEKVGGVNHSSHTTGNAIDISTYTLAPYEKERLLEMAQEKFDYVKIYPNFIHCQINS